MDVSIEVAAAMARTVMRARDKDALRVAVVGAGYVGLVTAACLAALGHRVRSVDIDPDRIRALLAGVVPFAEPGLEDLVRQGLDAGRLTFHVGHGEGLADSDIAMIAVGTLDRDGRWTDEFVDRALVELLAAPTLPRTIAIRSTLRPGSMARLQQFVVRAAHRSRLVLNPEFTREGTAVQDFLAPDRIVVGVAAEDDPEIAAQPVRVLFAGIDAPFLIVDHASAELIKIGSNAFLATKITFANELARLCVAAGADMAQVRQGIGLDSRIGPAFLAPGPGFGGSCLPSQVELLSAMSGELGLGLELIPAVHRFNLEHPGRLARDLLAELPGVERVAVLGLAFKANTDDTRESPAIRFISALHDHGVEEVRAFDPAVLKLPGHPWVTLSADPYEAAVGADVLAITTEWPEFRRLDWPRLASVMRGREVFDARSVIVFQEASEAGFHVHYLERPSHQRSDHVGAAHPHLSVPIRPATSIDALTRRSGSGWARASAGTVR